MAKAKNPYYLNNGDLYHRDASGNTARAPYGNESYDPSGHATNQHQNEADLLADYPLGQTAWWQGIASNPMNQAGATGIYQARNPQFNSGTVLAPGSYANHAATDTLSQPQIWNADPNIQRMSGQAQDMLDPSKGGPNLMTGPGQAFNPGQMASLYAMGQQALGQQNRAFTAGVAGAQAGRGGIGINPSAIMNSQNAAANRGALAEGNLKAQLEGLNLGVQQHGQKAGVFNTVSNVANQEAGRNLETQKLDYAGKLAKKQYAQDQASQAQKAIDDFTQRFAVELTSSPDGDNGKQIKENLRRELMGLSHNRDIWQSNLARYA